MTILYSAIARGTKVLCHHQEPTGTCYDSVISSILPNIPVGATAKTSYTTNSKICVNVLVDKGLTFICICSEDTGKSVPFELLNQLNKKIHETSIPIRALNCGENEFDREFGPTLVSMAERFNSNLNSNSNGLSSGGGQLSTLQNQVDEVKGVMIRNIEAVLEREQKLEDLVAKSSDLEAHASSFQKTATRVKRKMWWRNTRMMIALGLAVVIAVIILILIILFSSGVLPIHTDATTTTATTTTTTTTTTTHLP